MTELAGWMIEALRGPEDETLLTGLGAKVKALCERYPVPGIA